MADWYVYMVRCADKSLYTGITTSLERRVKQHNGELAGGAKYTKPRRPVVLVWQEVHTSRSGAAKREYAVKQLSRYKKLELLKSATPFGHTE